MEMNSNDLRRGLVVALAALVLPVAAAAQMKPLAIEIRGGLNFATGDLKTGIGTEGQADGKPVTAADQGGWTGSADLYWTFAKRGAA